MYIRVHHSLIKSSPALSHQLLWAKQGVTYVEIFIDRFLIDMKENTPNTTLLNPIGNVSTKANLNWSFFLESTFLREKYINIIKNPHAIECILVELNKKWNWLPKTFPFFVGSECRWEDSRSSENIHHVQHAERQGREIKAEKQTRAAAISGPASPLRGSGAPRAAPLRAPHLLIWLRATCSVKRQSKQAASNWKESRRTADWNRFPLRPRRGCAGRPVPFRLLTHSFLTYHDEYL